MKLTPSLFTDRPYGSSLQNQQSETVALFIMNILTRTGNEFRSITWDEYKAERIKDGNFIEAEIHYFNQVIYLAKGDKDMLINFSKVWRNAYLKQLEEIKA